MTVWGLVLASEERLARVPPEERAWVPPAFPAPVREQEGPERGAMQRARTWGE